MSGDLTVEQEAVMRALSSEGVPLRASEIGNWLMIGRPLTVLRQLERAGLVTQNANRYWAPTPECDSCGAVEPLRYSSDHGANFCQGCHGRENQPPTPSPHRTPHPRPAAGPGTPRRTTVSDQSEVIAQCVACDRDVTDHQPGIGLCRFVAEKDSPRERLRQAAAFLADPLAGDADRLRFRDRLLRAVDELMPAAAPDDVPTARPTEDPA